MKCEAVASVPYLNASETVPGPMSDHMFYFSACLDSNDVMVMINVTWFRVRSCFTGLKSKHSVYYMG